MEGIKDCTTAIDYNPKYERAYQRRAYLNAEEKNYDLAINDYTILCNMAVSNQVPTKGEASYKPTYDFYSY